jgi:phospholipid N-methyltransferase
MSKQTEPLLLFFRELFKNPHAVGAILPSAHKLAQRMAAWLPQGEGLVVELGAGTGVVTQALWARMNKVELLWVVERSTDFACHLNRKFPEANIVCGDASELSVLIPARPVDIIVSCLPLCSFSEREVLSITRQWHSVLAPQGIVVQFTYALNGADKFLKYGFYEHAHEYVWRNIPPARVQVLKASRTY